MMSNLDVNALSGPDGHRAEDFAAADVGASRSSSAHGREGSAAASAYSSPSTVSPGSTTSLVNEATSGKSRMSHSSELVYALHSTSDQVGDIVLLFGLFIFMPISTAAGLTVSVRGVFFHGT